MSKKKQFNLEPRGWYWVKVNGEWAPGQVSLSGNLIETLDAYHNLDIIDEIGNQILRETSN